MAGVYVHIPFCKQACYYCDFHFSTALQHKDQVLNTLLKEIDLRAAYLDDQEIQTIYFGGGTPSLLRGEEINQLIDQIGKHHTIHPQAEITLEANPDDLSATKINEFRHTPINRFSIGIQSFFEEDLRWMNRAHTAKEAESAIKRTQDAGFENITADLIYGYPLLSDAKWLFNIQQLLDVNIPHISAYSMTVEPQTALAHFIRSGKQNPMHDEQSASQFMQLTNCLAAAGFEHYEISNFARSKHYALHNTNYWRRVPYLGIGPSAHSFNGQQRQWNINNNHRYVEAIQAGRIPAEMEVLRLIDRLNESIMTALRTMWGIDLLQIEQAFGKQVSEALEEKSRQFIDLQQVHIDNRCVKLTLEGKLLADQIAADLFFEEEDITSKQE